MGTTATNGFLPPPTHSAIRSVSNIIRRLREIPFSDPSDLVPQGIIDPFNAYLYGRDTFYWDKHTYALAAGNYALARNKHWTHLASNTNVTADTVESIKYPYENRIWHNYSGQAGNPTGLGSAVSGTFDQPILTGRVLDDGTTQLTQTTYNSLGHVTDTIDPVGRETQFIYDTNQIDLLQVEQKTSLSGYSSIAQYTYNNQHLPLIYTDAAGQTTKYQYNPAGQLTQVTDALGEVTSYHYNVLGYLTYIVNPKGKVQESFTYDTYGRIATATDSEGYTVRYHYDNFDRLTQETFPDGTTRQYTWDKLDLASVKDRQGKITSYAHDAVRNLTQITDPLGHQTKLAYYENQTLKSLTDPDGNTTTWSIDLENRVTAKQYADRSTITNTYEATTSRLHAVTDALQQVKQYSYTPDDSLTGITYSNTVNSTPNVTFTYDPYFRRLTSMTDGSGTTQYTYFPTDTPGALRIASETVPEPHATIAYTYDALMRLASRSIDGIPEVYGYDKLSRLIYHHTAMGNFGRSYLGQTGQLVSQSIHSGAVGTTWAYDSNLDDRRLKAIDNGPEARSYQFTTTPEDLITEIREEGQLWEYQYDAGYRLADAFSSQVNKYSYKYDSAGNITSFMKPNQHTAASYNHLNQLVTFGNRQLAYDGDGNVLDDGINTYQWDAENRLISVTRKNDPTYKTTFAYDGLGRRIALDVPKSGPAGETAYLWCGEKLCQARTSANAVSRRYYLEGEYHPLNGRGLYYSVDQLGSVRDVLATQNGSRLASFDYDPYGNITESNEQATVDFRYSGMFYDQRDGLYLTHFRVYDSAIARWLSRDLIGEQINRPRLSFQLPEVMQRQQRLSFTPSPNLYAYVGNEPIGQIDPLGLLTFQIGFSGNVNLGIFNLTLMSVLPLIPLAILHFIQRPEVEWGSSGCGSWHKLRMVIRQQSVPTARWFGNVSANAGLGLDGSVDAFAGDGVVGSGVTFGVGAGADVAATATYTNLTPINY